MPISPAIFAMDFVSEIARPLAERSAAYEREFIRLLRLNQVDAEGKGPTKIVPRSNVTLIFLSHRGNTPTVTLKTRGATMSELSDGIQAAVKGGAPIPHYYDVGSAEEPEVFICASEDQSAVELMHWTSSRMLEGPGRGSARLGRPRTQ